VAFVTYWYMYDVRTFEILPIARNLMLGLVSSYCNIPYGRGKGVRRRAVEARFDGFSYSLGSEVRLASSWRLEMLDAGGHLHGVC
jgi:hypothetical protein